MRDTKTSELVESIVQISRQKNGDDLRLSLLKTVMEAMNADSTRFLRQVRGRAGTTWLEEYQALRAPQNPVGYALRLSSSSPVQLSAPMAACVNAGAALQAPGPEGRWQHILPVLDGGLVRELIVVQVPDNSTNEFRLTRAIVQLYQNYLDLVRSGERDTLTGLLNRRSLETSVSRLRLASQQASGADDEASGHWMAAIDIDHFKRVNDNFGHLFGDEVLLLVSRVMQQCFRGDDLLFRYGGEEFIAILEAASQIEARAALERLREQVSAYRFPQLGQVTVSIGFVELRPGALMSESVGHADQALYHAKAHGRNQVCSYDDLVSLQVAPTAQMNSAVEMF